MERGNERDVWIPCRVYVGIFSNEKGIDIDPPMPYYEPGIRGFVSERDIREEKRGEDGEMIGTARGVVVGDRVIEGRMGVSITFGGQLNHSDGVFFPRDYLEQRGVEVPKSM